VPYPSFFLGFLGVTRTLRRVTVVVPSSSGSVQEFLHCLFFFDVVPTFVFFFEFYELIGFFLWFQEGFAV